MASQDKKTASTRLHEPIYITDDAGFSTEDFILDGHYTDCIDRVLIPHGMIMDRISRLAQVIHRDCNGETLHLLCVLKGASAFFEDFCHAFRTIHRFSGQDHIPYTFDFIRVKSYEGMESTGNVQISGIDLSTLEGKHCVLVEDLIDTGTTMSNLVPHIKQAANVASIRVASLMEKRTPRSCGFKADYCGFSIPDVFIIGYNMDYNEAFREMEHLCVINKCGIEKYADYK